MKFKFSKTQIFISIHPQKEKYVINLGNCHLVQMSLHGSTGITLLTCLFLTCSRAKHIFEKYRTAHFSAFCFPLPVTGKWTNTTSSNKSWGNTTLCLGLLWSYYRFSPNVHTHAKKHRHNYTNIKTVTLQGTYMEI